LGAGGRRFTPQGGTESKERILPPRPFI